MTAAQRQVATANAQADALRELAAYFLSEDGLLFDNDHDNAIVAARIDERADEIEAGL